MLRYVRIQSDLFFISRSCIKKDPGLYVRVRVRVCVIVQD